ncbi:unnamed protein product, partial [Musa acuminata subsp. burmannicoides]
GSLNHLHDVSGDSSASPPRRCGSIHRLPPILTPPPPPLILPVDAEHDIEPSIGSGLAGLVVLADHLASNRPFPSSPARRRGTGGRVRGVPVQPGGRATASGGSLPPRVPRRVPRRLAPPAESPALCAAPSWPHPSCAPSSTAGSGRSSSLGCPLLIRRWRSIRATTTLHSTSNDICS